jgi:hypothetical protein
MDDCNACDDTSIVVRFAGILILKPGAAISVWPETAWLA